MTDPTSDPGPVPDDPGFDATFDDPDVDDGDEVGDEDGDDDDEDDEVGGDERGGDGGAIVYVVDPLAPADALRVLATADLQIQGRMPWSSNATFLTDLCADGDVVAQAIYKPERGERPLWDFPAGLYQREVAAYRLWAWLGWTELVGGGVPPTIVRHEAPYGTGSVQLFVPSDFEQHYFTIFEAREDLHPALRAIGAFDLMVNNTDRKGGHCLLGLDGNVWAIDNGLCFAAEFKLRTVIWEFGGDPIPDDLLPGIERLASGVPGEVADLLAPEEADALSARAARLVAKPRFPTDPSGRRYPWPMV